MDSSKNHSFENKKSPLNQAYVDLPGSNDLDPDERRLRKSINEDFEEWH